MQMKTGRIETLCDSIFAIAMTLMVVSIGEIFHWPKSITEKEFIGLFSELWPDMLYYFQSFIILGAFWLAHHRQFHYIKSADTALILINIGAMMFVSLIPFTTAIAGDYGNHRPAALIFEANLLIAGALFHLHWTYATRRNGLVDPAISPKVVRSFSYGSLAIPAVSVAAMGLSLIKPSLGTMLYFAVPFIVLFRRG
jgi:uncharacterized membrane protein